MPVRTPSSPAITVSTMGAALLVVHRFDAKAVGDSAGLGAVVNRKEQPGSEPTKLRSKAHAPALRPTQVARFCMHPHRHVAAPVCAKSHFCELAVAARGTSEAKGRREVRRDRALLEA